MQELEIDDAIVLLLGAHTKIAALRDQIRGVTRLEKLVFLIDNETLFGELIKEDAEFRPYNFGPFSEVVYKAVGFLSSYGLIEDTGSSSENTEDSWEQIAVISIERPDPYVTRDFRLTGSGKKYYAALAKDIPANFIRELSDFKDQFGSIPLRQLIRYVYRRYPHVTEQSLISSRGYRRWMRANLRF